MITGGRDEPALFVKHESDRLSNFFRHDSPQKIHEETHAVWTLKRPDDNSKENEKPPLSELSNFKYRAPHHHSLAAKDARGGK